MPATATLTRGTRGRLCTWAFGDPLLGNTHGRAPPAARLLSLPFSGSPGELQGLGRGELRMVQCVVAELRENYSNELPPLASESHPFLAAWLCHPTARVELQAGMTKAYALPTHLQTPAAIPRPLHHC